jgi:endonuclease YncB( thermonuclease family)
MKSPVLLLAVMAAAGSADAAPEGYFELRPGITLESGDSWVDAGTRYHLYGVQACLRDTFLTDKSGHRRDCGEASLAVLAAYIADTKPLCAAVARTHGTVHVACYATVGSDRLDLANLMIASGYAFAALRADGLPYHPAYAVAEQVARERGAGLWQFKDVQHPSVLIGRAASEEGAAQ